jgi:hypothetical protein
MMGSLSPRFGFGNILDCSDHTQPLPENSERVRSQDTKGISVETKVNMRQTIGPFAFVGLFL